VQQELRTLTFVAILSLGGPSSAGNDGFLPAVLVLLHTIRKYAKEDRDFIALVSEAVSEVCTILMHKSMFCDLCALGETSETAVRRFRPVYFLCLFAGRASAVGGRGGACHRGGSF
jgi:hypothetical protein